MTTTTETTTTRTCPPSAVADQILPWEDVKAGDLVLWDGEFCPVEQSQAYPGDPGVWLITLAGALRETLPCGTYAAVRRYTEGISERDALGIAALDEAAADRIERAKPSGCPECAVLSPGTLCPEHGGHFARAQAYWDERDRREAGL